MSPTVISVSILVVSIDFMSYAFQYFKNVLNIMVNVNLFVHLQNIKTFLCVYFYWLNIILFSVEQIYTSETRSKCT